MANPLLTVSQDQKATSTKIAHFASQLRNRILKGGDKALSEMWKPAKAAAELRKTLVLRETETPEAAPVELRPDPKQLEEEMMAFIDDALNAPVDIDLDDEINEKSDEPLEVSTPPPKSRLGIF